MSKLIQLDAQAVALATVYNSERVLEGKMKAPQVLKLVLGRSFDLLPWYRTIATPEGVQLVAELQRSIGLAGDGAWGPKSQSKFARVLKQRAKYVVEGEYGPQLRPGTPELRAACVEACRWLGRTELTTEEFLALSNIVRRESEGWCKRPNYTSDRLEYYNRRRVDSSERYSEPENREAWEYFAADIRRNRIRSKSSAVGVGQLLGRNYDIHCPLGRDGIGNVVAELAGMIAYCDARYGGPVPAWEFYELDHCPDDRKSYYAARALIIGCKPGEGY